ncbi:unnamed protein product, partial [marine sediment metagenome]
RKFMQDLFANHTVLFIGSSMSELELLEYLADPERKGHFILESFWEDSLAYANYMSEYFDTLGVEVVPYAKDIKGYEQLRDVILDWKNKIRSVALPPPTTEGLRIIDNVEL